MPGMYINRESGAIARVEKVDEHYAQLAITHSDGRHSRFAMPIADYDGSSPNTAAHFTESWRPAEAADIEAQTPEGFRPPANTIVAESEEREVDEGVVISPELE